MIPPRIGEILVKNGVLTRTQLDKIIKKAEKGEDLREALVKNGVSEKEIAKAYAELSGAEYLDKITETEADQGLLAKVPLRFLRDNTVIPLRIDNSVMIATSNPTLFQPLDEIRLTLSVPDAYFVVTTPQEITDAINKYYPLEGTKQMIADLEEEAEGEESIEFEEIEGKDLLGMANEAPIIKLVNHIIYQGVKQDASDIHIEPAEKEVYVRYRIDGVLHRAMTPPKRVQNALTSRIKIMANLNIAERRLPQDGRIEVKVGEKEIDIRVSVLPVIYGESIVMRLLDKTRTFVALEKLGFSKRDLEAIKKSTEKPNGIFFISGPTGSGKTSTLYSILSRLNTPEVNIITVEDPIEYQMNGINQVPVKAKIGLTFATALRAILRQDPNIIMIGETRDFETAQIAIQASLTGHLVLSTIHTNSAPATITRLLDMGIEPFLIASSIEAVSAQRLVRRLCSDCKKKYKPSAELLKDIGVSSQKAKSITFYEPGGCNSCGNLGYRGRVAIFEIMEMTNAIAKLTMERADTNKIMKQAKKDGMTTLLEDGVRKIAEGLTTIDEVLSVTAVESL